MYEMVHLLSDLHLHSGKHHITGGHITIYDFNISLGSAGVGYTAVNSVAMGTVLDYAN